MKGNNLPCLYSMRGNDLPHLIIYVYSPGNIRFSVICICGFSFSFQEFKFPSMLSKYVGHCLQQCLVQNGTNTEKSWLEMRRVSAFGHEGFSNCSCY